VSPPIALLTDFGQHDAYVGMMKGVILGRHPDAQIVDLCHEVPPQDVRRGAFLLATSVQYFPAGTVFLAIVDPGVGTARRPLAVEATDWRFVGPDNGLLVWALRFLAPHHGLSLAGSEGRLLLKSGLRAVELTESRFWRPEVSSTFHGRDIFSPVAAELSLGRPLDEFGPQVDWLVDLPWPEPCPAADGVVGEVITVDGFGNLVTNLRAGDLPSRPVFLIASYEVKGLSESFQSGSDLVAVLGSSGFVELAAPSGSAATLLRAGAGTHIRAASAPQT
jgi:hypothetical protein